MKFAIVVLAALFGKSPPTRGCGLKSYGDPWYSEATYSHPPRGGVD